MLGLGSVGLTAQAFDAWVLQGILIPVRVAGDSMVPTLYGQHLASRCTCGRLFRTARPPNTTTNGATPNAIPNAAPARVVTLRCPSCDKPLRSLRKAPGDRVVVHRYPLWWRSPHRFELVTLRAATDDRATAQQPATKVPRTWIKRVWGLPGEVLEIVSGDVLVNGNPLKRSLGDHPRPPLIPVPATWKSVNRPAMVGMIVGETIESEMIDGGLLDGKTKSAPIWIPRQYHGFGASRVLVPITAVFDDVAFNRFARRSLHRVDDLIVAGQMQRTSHISKADQLSKADQPDAFVIIEQAIPPDVLHWKLHQVAANASETEIPGSAAQSSGGWSFECYWNRQLIHRAEVPQDAASPVDFRVGYLDGSGVIEIGSSGAPDGVSHRIELPRRDARQPISRADASGQAFPAVVSVTTSGTMEVRGLALWRDLYVTLDTPAAKSSKFTLRDSEYLVLGDNSPVSEDSRHVGRPIRGGDFVGVVQRSRRPTD